MATDPLGLFCTPDFVLHYYSWSGTTIDLGAVGLLNTFEQSSSVRGAVQTFKLKVSSTARAKAKSLCKNCDDGIKHTTFSVNGKDTTDVTHEPCLFSVGRSTFFEYAGCSLSVDCKTRTYPFSCGLNFSIRDSFQDPANITEKTGLPFEPWGRPYMITAGGSESFSGTGRF